VRGRGLMWGVEFNSEILGQFAMLSIIKEGVLQNYCRNKKDTLIMMPPLIVNEEEIEEIVKRIRKGVKKIKHLA
jgi:putrescine aminotransferase